MADGPGMGMTDDITPSSWAVEVLDRLDTGHWAAANLAFGGGLTADDLDDLEAVAASGWRALFRQTERHEPTKLARHWPYIASGHTHDLRVDIWARAGFTPAAFDKWEQHFPNVHDATGWLMHITDGDHHYSPTPSEVSHAVADFDNSGLSVGHIYRLHKLGARPRSVAHLRSNALWYQGAGAEGLTPDDWLERVAKYVKAGGSLTFNDRSDDLHGSANSWSRRNAPIVENAFHQSQLGDLYDSLVDKSHIPDTQVQDLKALFTALTDKPLQLVSQKQIDAEQQQRRVQDRQALRQRLSQTQSPHQPRPLRSPPSL